MSSKVQNAYMAMMIMGLGFRLFYEGSHQLVLVYVLYDMY